MEKSRVHKYSIKAPTGYEEFDNYQSFDKRRNALKNDGLILTYQINSSLGNEFFTDKVDFYNRMKDLHKAKVPFFPLVLIEEQPKHYLSLNAVKKDKALAMKYA